MSTTTLANFHNAKDTLFAGSTEPTKNEDIAICNIGVSAHRGCDDTNMIVPTSDQKGKQYCCIYCLKRFQKLERHLRTVHKREPDVQKFLAFRPRKVSFLLLTFPKINVEF